MKKVFLIFLCVLITTGAGYKGTLPNINAEFAYKREAKDTSNPPYTPVNPQDNTEDKKEELLQIPRDNNAYLEIIIKKDKTAQYITDTNKIILIIEKLKKCIENGQDIQKFNAIVSNLIDHIALMETSYKGKAESNYISYRNLLQLSETARNVAVLRTEGQVYNKYLPYSSSGSVYTSDNIQAHLNLLLDTVNESLYVLKNLD